MFFLLRLAFWLGLVLVLLPRNQPPDSNGQPKVEASEAISAATAAVADMSRFCTRQPTACQVGGEAASMIGHRAKDGARVLYHFFTDQNRTGSIDAADSERGHAAGTLSPSDRQMEWKLSAADAGATTD